MKEEALTEEAKALTDKRDVETRWLYTTSENFPKLVEISRKTCVIPMGCVEMHGLHLPLGTDIIEVSALTDAASRLEPVAVFPDFTFGDVPGCEPRHAGHIALPVEMEMALLEQLCDQIALNGFEKIMVINGHGGNGSWLGSFSRNLNNRKKSYAFAVYHMGLPCPHKMAEHLLEHGSGSIPELVKEDEALLLKYHEEKLHIGHACMGETAFLMAVAPDSVHLDRLGVVSGKSLHKTDYLTAVGIHLRDDGWDINYPNAFSEDDFIINDRIASAAFRMEAEHMARAFKVLKDDENIMKWHEESQRGWR